jgi:type VI secretion system ImpM family protein
MPETERPTGNAPGFFGKLPSHGDFISRRLPTELLAAWEAWLDVGLQHSRDSLGDAWLQTYLSSPIWCFSASADCCGAQPFAGVPMPSLDWVGRYYSLSIVVPFDRRPRSPWGKPIGSRGWRRSRCRAWATISTSPCSMQRARRRTPAESRQQESGFGDALPRERSGRGVADPARQAVAAGRCAIQPLVDIRIEDDGGLLPRFSWTAAG